MHIWFQLLMYGSGQVYWMGAWETYEECEVVKWAYEEQYKGLEVHFSCPFITTEEV